MCIALLEPRRPQETFGMPGSDRGGAAGEARSKLQAEAVAGISPYCDRLLAMLDDAAAPDAQVSSRTTAEGWGPLCRNLLGRGNTNSRSRALKGVFEYFT